MLVRSAIAALICAWSIPGVAAEPIDGRSAGRWQAQPGWTPTRMTSQFGLSDQQGWLAFLAGGHGKQMTWILAPTPAELAGEPQWLLLRYRASGIQPGAGDLMLSAQAGNDRWLHLVSQRSLVCDGQEHALAVDLWSYDLPTALERVLLRIGPVSDAEGKLWARLQLVDRPSDGAQRLAHQRPPEVRSALEFERIAWQASPNWVPNPPEQQSQQATGGGVRFAIRGRMKSMRWSARLTAPPDLGRTPHVAIRYRAQGEFGPSGYVFYLGTTSKDPQRRSVYAMRPGDVVPDGQWHVHTARLDSSDPLTGAAAVGIDSLAAESQIELDWIAFSSVPPHVPLEQAFAFQNRGAAWPPDQDGFTPLAPPKARAAHPQFLRRLALDGWFASSEIHVHGIPFRVVDHREGLAATGTIDEESLETPLAPGAQEILLLLAAAFPRSEKFGASWQRETPLVTLDEPERMAIEIVYADGSVEQMLPVSAATGQYGVQRDLGVYAVRPAAGKTAVRLRLHDRMRNAAFGLLGVTINSRQPQVPEPQLAHLWYPPTQRPAPAAEQPPAELRFASAGGLTWQAIHAPLLGPGGIDLSAQPVFRLLVENRSISSAEFTLDKPTPQGDESTIAASLVRDGLRLRAELTVTTAADGPRLLGLRLTNAGDRPVTGRLEFPTVGALRIGEAGQTWYFCARRGGAINRVNTEFRDEIGEGHPLAVDGFFNPQQGVGVCFMPRDLEGVFRWYRLGKDDDGGSYALEFLPQTVAPRSSWTSVPVAVAVLAGDWREQFAAYRRWLSTWYKALAPRKPWFRGLWSFPSIGPRNPRQTPLDQRLDFLALAERRNQRIPGSTDYMHLYGWAETEQYGHWGAYDHYHELGGREHFREAVSRTQQAGRPVGLYLDGYLVSTQSDKPSPAQVEQWSVRTAAGAKLYHPEYDAHSMCPYVAAWRDYLCGAYRRVAEEVRPSGMYLDEFGKCMTGRICYSPDHGHPVPMGMCAGEWLLTRQIRQAVPPAIATYCEFVPADVASQYLDGAYGHVSLDNHRAGFGRLAPHFVNLHRFAMPDFKTFELIYYVPLRNGNWHLLKYPFFNGDGYYLTDQELQGYDEHSRAFLARVFRLQHAHCDAFTSLDVEPLVATAAAGLYANRFATPTKTVWTFLNTNYRTLRGDLLRVASRPGVEYWDAWNGRPIPARSEGGQTVLGLEIGPRSVGCVVQRAR